MKSKLERATAREAICSQAARRMSKPVTIAPDAAVAIALPDAGPEHQDAGRTDRAGSGGEHAPEAARLARGDQSRGITGRGRLRGKCVHRPGAGGARNQFHRQGGDPGRGEGVVGLRRGQRRDG